MTYGEAMEQECDGQACPDAAGTGPATGDPGGPQVPRARTRIWPRPRASAEETARVRIVHALVEEMFELACEGRLAPAEARSRARCHSRQIAMYLCRVVLSMRYRAIAGVFGRERSTAIHGCAMVEDRRDDKVYDAFVDRCERCVRAVFQVAEAGDERG